MSTTNALARPPFVLTERDVNAPARRSNDASISDEHGAKNASASTHERATKMFSPSKSGAVERQRKMQLGSAPNTSSPAPASQRPASSPTVVFSDDPYAGLYPDEDQQQDGDDSNNKTKRLILYGSYTHTLIVGRSKPSGKAHASSVASNGATDPSTALSQTEALVRAEVEALHRHSPSLAGGLKSSASSGASASSPAISAKHMRVCLPNDARHVSRVHALIHYSPFPSSTLGEETANISPQKIPTAMLGSFLLRIVGQNGLYVNGERLRAETIVPLIPGRTRLGFFSDVEAMFDIKTDAMPAHIRSRALELQSRLVPRISSAPRISSPIKKRSKSTPSSSFLNLVKAATESPRQGVQGGQKGARKDTRPKHSAEIDYAAPTPPPTSSPSRESEGTSQDMVSQSLLVVKDRPLDRHDGFSPPPSSSPVIGAGDRDPLTGLRKRKHYEVVEASEDESDFGSGDESDYPQEPQSSAPNSSPAAAASRRRIAERGLTSPSKADRDAQSHSSEEENSESESDSGLSSPSSLSDDSSTPSPVRRPPTLFKKVSSGAASDSQSKMPPPPVPVRSTVRQAVAGQSSGVVNRSSNAPGPAPVNADPIAVGRGRYLQSAARRAVGSVAPSYDLEGLLAVSIVFHRTATMAASEAVRNVLNANEGLMRGIVGPRLAATDQVSSDSGASSEVGEGKALRCFSFEHALDNTPTIGGRKLRITSSQWTTALTKAWREQLELVLRYSSAGSDTQGQPSSLSQSQSRAPRGPFGAIQRAGKDSAGNPLEPWYYYIAEADPDRERAANLAEYVKPIRGALKVHKPIYWKKSAYGHTDAEIGPGDDEEEEGTMGVGGTSYLSRTVANDVWGTNVEEGLGANDSSTSAHSGASGLETQFNGLSESLVASSRFGYSNRADTAGQQTSAVSSSSSSSSAAVGSGKAFRQGVPVQQLDAPEGATQGLVDRVWSETQDEEEREETWDKVGDMDWQG